MGKSEGFYNIDPVVTLYVTTCCLSDKDGTSTSMSKLIHDASDSFQDTQSLFVSGGLNLTPKPPLSLVSKSGLQSVYFLVVVVYPTQSFLDEYNPLIDPIGSGTCPSLEGPDRSVPLLEP